MVAGVGNVDASPLENPLSAGAESALAGRYEEAA
jgi:hypothetical protein